MPKRRESEGNDDRTLEASFGYIETLLPSHAKEETIVPIINQTAIVIEYYHACKVTLEAVKKYSQNGDSPKSITNRRSKLLRQASRDEKALITSSALTKDILATIERASAIQGAYFVQALHSLNSLLYKTFSEKLMELSEKHADYQNAHRKLVEMLPVPQDTERPCKTHKDSKQSSKEDAISSEPLALTNKITQLIQLAAENGKKQSLQALLQNKKAWNLPHTQDMKPILMALIDKSDIFTLIPFLMPDVLASYITIGDFFSTLLLQARKMVEQEKGIAQANMLTILQLSQIIYRLPQYIDKSAHGAYQTLRDSFRALFDIPDNRDVILVYLYHVYTQHNQYAESMAQFVQNIYSDLLACTNPFLDNEQEADPVLVQAYSQLVRENLMQYGASQASAQSLCSSSVAPQENIALLQPEFFKLNIDHVPPTPTSIQSDRGAGNSFFEEEFNPRGEAFYQSPPSGFFRAFSSGRGNSMPNVHDDKIAPAVGQTKVRSHTTSSLKEPAAATSDLRNNPQTRSTPLIPSPPQAIRRASDGHKEPGSIIRHGRILGKK